MSGSRPIGISSHQSSGNEVIDLEPGESDNSEDIFQTPPSKKTRSIVHEFFVVKDERYHCTVQNCKTTFAVDKRASTSGLWRHLKTVHPHVLKGEKSQPEGLFKYFKFVENQEVEVFTKEWFMNLVMFFVIAENQPFTVAESDHFRKLLEYCNSAAILPSADTVRNRVRSMYAEEAANLMVQFQASSSKIAFILDGWTSKNQWPFQGIIAIWVNGFQVQQVILDLSILSGSHTGANLAESFYRVLERFNLLDRISAITTDNAPNMDTFFVKFKKLMDSHGSSFDVNNQRVRCLAHIINLACKEALKVFEKFAEVEGRLAEYESSENDSDAPEIPTGSRKKVKKLSLVGKIRKGVQKIRSSSQRRESFRNQCVAAKITHNELILDVATRWNSTYSMLEWATELRRSFECTLRADKSLRVLVVEDNGWAKLKLMMTFLKPFKDVTLEISKSNYSTMAMSGMIYVHLFSHLESFMVDPAKNLKGINPERRTVYPRWLQDAAKMAHNKLSKYYPTSSAQAFVVSTVMDPRCKFDCYRKITMFRATLKNYQDSVARVWVKGYRPEEIETNVSKTTGTLFENQLKRIRLEDRDELEIYVSAPPVQYDSVKDSIQWWQERRAEFPNLSNMAMDFLPISGSGVPVERLFSIGPDILTTRRLSMSPTTIQELFCLKGWLASKEQQKLASLSREAIVAKILDD